jgi:hypothetical protein
MFLSHRSDYGNPAQNRLQSASMSSSKPLFDAPRVGGDICKSQHNHRKGTGIAPARVSSTRTPGAPKARVSAKSSTRWEDRLGETRGKDPVPYDARKAFGRGDVLNHPNFGVGVIEEVKANGKILVLFRDGEKVLIHGRTA